MNSANGKGGLQCKAATDRRKERKVSSCRVSLKRGRRWWGRKKNFLTWFLNSPDVTEGGRRWGWNTIRIAVNNLISFPKWHLENSGMILFSYGRSSPVVPDFPPLSILLTWFADRCAALCALIGHLSPQNYFRVKPVLHAFWKEPALVPLRAVLKAQTYCRYLYTPSCI